MTFNSLTTKFTPLFLFSVITLTNASQTPIKPSDLSSTDIAKQLNWISSPDAHNQCKGYYKQPLSTSSITTLSPIKKTPTAIKAKGITTFNKDGSTTLHDHVTISQPGRILESDNATVFRDPQTGVITTIKLSGHIKVIQPGAIALGSYAESHPNTHETLIKNVLFHLNLTGNAKNFWGTSDTANEDSEQNMTFTSATISMCPPNHPFWEIQAKKITIDHKKKRAKIQHAVLKIKKIPVFYSPYLTLPLTKNRKSGFLMPSFANSTQNGTSITTPFYWNLAPNYDDLITPSWLSDRGFQLNNKFRYLTPVLSGDIFFSVIPNDKEFQSFKNTTLDSASAAYIDYTNALESMSDSHGFIHWDNDIHINTHWNSHLLINYSSDPYYYSDFETDSSLAWSRQLENTLSLTYSSPHWEITGLTQAYQTIHLIYNDSNIFNQYQRLPEVDADAIYPYFYKNLSFSLQSQLVNFDYHSDYTPYTYEEPIGQRLFLSPSITREFNGSQGFLSPQVILNSRTYNTQLATTTSNTPRTSQETYSNIPTIDIDSGLYFNRTITWRHTTLKQTLEPRLFYLYTPYQDQNDLPVYDTESLPFSYTDLFSTNAFAGSDRIQNANQLSLGLSTQVSDPNTGDQRFNAGIGVINYFTPQKVCLSTDCTDNKNTTSPITGEMTFYPKKDWSSTLSSSWDTKDHHFDHIDLTAAYNYHETKTLDIGYEFIRSLSDTDTASSPLDNTQLIKIGSAYPITDRWSALGFWFYNITEDHPESYFAGLQYNTCCWAMRITANHYLNYSTNLYQNNYFLELQFKGLGSAGHGISSGMLANALPSFHDIFTN